MKKALLIFFTKTVDKSVGSICNTTVTIFKTKENFSCLISQQGINIQLISMLMIFQRETPESPRQSWGNRVHCE